MVLAALLPSWGGEGLLGEVTGTLLATEPGTSWHHLVGVLIPQTQQIGSLGMHPVLKTSHGWAMSLLGWVQTQRVLTERSGTGQRGNAGCKDKLYLGTPRKVAPSAGKHRGVPGPMLSSIKAELFLLRHPGEGASGRSGCGRRRSLTRLFVRNFQPQLAKTSQVTGTVCEQTPAVSALHCSSSRPRAWLLLQGITY